MPTQLAKHLETQSSSSLVSLGCLAATLVDHVSSGAVVSVSPHGGVSVHMEMNYFSPTPGGQDCEVDSRVTKAGRTLAFAEVKIRNKSSGKVTARGTHIKFIPPMPDAKTSATNLPKGTPKAAISPVGAIEFMYCMPTEYLECFYPDATQNFETTALHGLTDITASTGQVKCVLPVKKRVQNCYSTLHGGCIGECCLFSSVPVTFSMSMQQAFVL